MEWPDLTGFGLHLKTFYFKDVFGFNNEIIGTINLLIDTVPVIRADKAKTAGLICLIGQPNHNIYEEVDVNKPETLLMSPSITPPNLYQIPTESDVIIEPALFVAQLGLPIGRYRKVSTTQAEIDYHFYKYATPILNRMKLMLQAQFPYIKNQSDIQIISGPFGHYLDDNLNNIDDLDPTQVLLTDGKLKEGDSSEYLSECLIEIYKHHPLSQADINNIVGFSCHAQPKYRQIVTGSQTLVEPIMPTINHKVELEQMFHFSEFVKGRWVSNIQEVFLAATLKDDYATAQLSQQALDREDADRFQSTAMILPQSQEWLLDLCESDKNNPFNQLDALSDTDSYKTPLFVCYQIARLLSVDGMYEPIDRTKGQVPTLLDMTAGFGNLWPFLTNCSITAFESDSNIYKYLPTISRMFNFLQDNNEFLPCIDDVLNESVLNTSLSSTAQGDDLGYHYILATPDFTKSPDAISLPFIDRQGVYHFEAKSNRLDHHIVALGLQHLKQHGRMVFLLGVDKPGDVTEVESFFYQYLHTYFIVDLIIEMGSAIFYGSGYNGNVRVHVVSGRRDMPRDESDIVERTQAALRPVMPIAKNNSQLNNLVQHYTSNKYKKTRFDKLISNSLEGVVKRPLPPKIPPYRLLFTNKYAYFKQDIITSNSMFSLLGSVTPTISIVKTDEPVVDTQAVDDSVASQPDTSDTEQVTDEAVVDSNESVDEANESVTDNSDTDDTSEAAADTLADDTTDGSDDTQSDEGTASTDNSKDDGEGEGNYPAKSGSIEEDEWDNQPDINDDEFEIMGHGGIDFSSDDEDTSYDDDYDDDYSSQDDDNTTDDDSITDIGSTDTDSSNADLSNSNVESAAENSTTTETESESIDFDSGGVVVINNDDDSTSEGDDDSNDDDSNDGDVEQFASNPQPDADPLPAMDAISLLKQGKLARVSACVPQSLAMVKQPSLTGRATGHTTRLISSTQLALYQEIPNISNDLFSLTSSIDAWLYKTFNLSFKAAQKLFGLLPDFAKHAAAYYCTAAPTQHIIFDTSRRSQYFIAALVVLHKLKTRVDNNSSQPITISYSSSIDLIELIHAFDVLATVVSATYDKKSNPIEQMLELVNVLYKLSAGKSAIDILHLLRVQDTKKALDVVVQSTPDSHAKPFLLIIGSDYFGLIERINAMSENEYDHLIITSHDVFDVESLPNLSSDAGSETIYSLMPYYLTEGLTTAPNTLLKDKRLFFLLYEKCLHRASGAGFIQYNYEPLTYAHLPVRVLDRPVQEGLDTLMDTLYHLTNQMKAVNGMSCRVRDMTNADDSDAISWFYRDASDVIDECLIMSKISLGMGVLQDIISDNYRNGKHSTIPITSNYANLIAEYLLYNYHSADFIEYYQDNEFTDATEWLLRVTHTKDLSGEYEGGSELVLSKNKAIDMHQQMHADSYKKDFDQESVLARQASITKTQLAGYHCPNMKELLEFVAKRSSMTVVIETDDTEAQLVGVDAYADLVIDGKRTVLCDITVLLSEANTAAFDKRTDIIRKFISIIPKNDISALPFEYAVYQLSRVSVNALYVSSNLTRYVINDVVDGRDTVPRLIIEAETRTPFNFGNDVYSATNDAVFINMEAAYFPHLGIAPLRYDRYDCQVDHFRQRSLIITEFLPPSTLKELVLKISVPDAKLHHAAMVVTDYIDIDVVEVKSYGEFNDLMTVSAMRQAGFEVKGNFDINDHGHYLALNDLLMMPQAIKLGLFSNRTMGKLSHSKYIDAMYSQIKKLTQLDGLKQIQLANNLNKYMSVYHTMYPNGLAWYQNLFYIHHDLKATPLYDDKTPGENLYPRQFQYQHTAGFTPTVAMVVATAKAFVLSQYKTIEAYVESMSDEAKSTYYSKSKNIAYEMFIGLSKAHQSAHIYSADFRKQNIHAFKRVVLSEFGVNLGNEPDIEAAVKSANISAVTTLYQNLVFVNNHVSHGAKFISDAFECRVDGETETQELTNFVVNAKVSNNNIDADAFFYGYNHNASPLRRNDKQLYMIWLGVMLPQIKFNDSPTEQFSLTLPRHLRCPIITNQHDKLIFLDYLSLHGRWQALTGNYRLTIKPKNNELAPYIEGNMDAQGNKLSESEFDNLLMKAQVECDSFCKAFSGSKDVTNISSFKFITESALSNSVQGENWGGKTGLYDVIRFSNNTNHSFIHIIKKLTHNN